MMRSTFANVVLLSLITLCSACAISNQGTVDYRYNRPGTNQGILNPKYIRSEAAANLISAGDPITVSLKQVFVKDFTEYRSLLRVIRNEPTTGDIAIVSSTCEDPCNRKFGSDGIKSSKVIFYSNDVRRGQFLNLSNLHGVFGPITYGGNPLKFDFYIIELDTDGTQLRNLAANLAGLGETFYPPAHPATAILSSLAEVFIKDDQDDNIFTFSFDLKSPTTENSTINPSSAAIEAGNYVLIRSEDRTQQIPWSILAYNDATGRVVHSRCASMIEPTADCFYTDNSYMVIEVSKAKNAVSNDAQQIIFSALKSSITATGPSILNNQLTAEKMQEIRNSLESTEIRGRTVHLLKAIKDSPPDSQRRRLETLNLASIWFDGSKTILPSDTSIVAAQANDLLGQCAGLSTEDALLYQDAIRTRTLVNKAAFVNALVQCPFSK
ncbi:hypothetical protein [Pseudomonas sp. Tri1]|uniref:hypothetical protein n=1 Tax=Pseudomonas sp. Tri1 TaxID=2823875 RepID=UPI001B340ECA|nr:hypothetical protein [Pseudomonas sp. Tri1]